MSTVGSTSPRPPTRTLASGLWAVDAGHQFGGVGAMIERPELNLSIRPAEQLDAGGQQCEIRAIAFARRWAEFHRLSPPTCPNRHSLDRAGTCRAGQRHATCGAAVAAGLSNAFSGLPSRSPQELALSVSRRPTVGRGNLWLCIRRLGIVEQGKLPGEPISPLDCRIDLPEAWRFVLVACRWGLSGLAGRGDEARFARFPKCRPPQQTS